MKYIHFFVPPVAEIVAGKLQTIIGCGAFSLLDLFFCLLTELLTFIFNIWFVVLKCIQANEANILQCLSEFSECEPRDDLYEVSWGVNVIIWKATVLIQSQRQSGRDRNEQEQ